MPNQEALITPSVLKWAIQRAGISVDSIHAKAKKWVEGEARPTFKQAIDIANKLQIPFGYLWLKEPPIEQEIIPDLRTIGNSKNPQTPLWLKTLLRDTKAKQEWYKNYLLQNDEPKCNVVGKFLIYNDKNLIVNDIIEKLQIQKIIGSRKNKDDMLKILVSNTERLGILVMRNRILGNNTRINLDINEFRGFAIYDDVAPLVFINTSDSKAAQIFTLLHELAHLWIGKEGISDLDFNTDNKIELFCNEIAAMVLMPENKIKAEYARHNDDNWLQEISNQFSVSAFAVLNRLKTLNILDFDEYKELYDEEIEKFNSIPKVKSKSGSAPIETMTRIRNGELLTFAVVSSVLNNQESYTDGANLLGFKTTDIINKMGKELGFLNVSNRY